MNSHARAGRRRPLAAVAMSLVAGAVMVVAVPVLAGTASAHGGDATAELVAFTPAPDGASAQVSVRLTFQNDGDPVDEATVTISGDDLAGHSLTPATLDAGPQPGLFEGTLRLPAPGTWNLRVTSIDPNTSLTFTQTVAAAPTTTTSIAPVTTAAVTSTTEGAAIVAGERASDSTDDGGSSAGWIVAVVVGVALVAGIVFVAIRRRGASNAQ